MNGLNEKCEKEKLEFCNTAQNKLLNFTLLISGRLIRLTFNRFLQMIPQNEVLSHETTEENLRKLCRNVV